MPSAWGDSWGINPTYDGGSGGLPLAVDLIVNPILEVDLQLTEVQLEVDLIAQPSAVDLEIVSVSEVSLEVESIDDTYLSVGC